MDELTRSSLAQLAARAQAAGRGADVVDYWCELGEMIAGFALQARGWYDHGYAEKGWRMGFPEDSACCALCQVCDLARPRLPANSASLSDGARATLAEHFKGSDEHDPVAGAARLLARAWAAPADRSPEEAARVTATLCESVAAVAKELEASWSPEMAREALNRCDPRPEYQDYSAARHHVQWRRPEYWSPSVTAGIVGKPAPPSSGEVERALAHCAFLAQGRLFPGLRLDPAHSRYQLGSLRSRSGLAPAESISSWMLSWILDRHFLRTWWLSTEEEIEIAPHESFTVDLAGWRRDRFPSDPASTSSIAGTEPARDRPDWICDQVKPGESADARSRKQSIYQRVGVPWCWLVDVQSRVIRVQKLVGDEYHLELVADGARRVALPPFDSEEIDLGPIFPPPGWRDTGLVEPKDG
jgi:hypothetical protein